MTEHQIANSRIVMGNKMCNTIIDVSVCILGAYLYFKKASENKLTLLLWLVIRGSTLITLTIPEIFSFLSASMFLFIAALLLLPNDEAIDPPIEETALVKFFAVFST